MEHRPPGPWVRTEYGYGFNDVNRHRKNTHAQTNKRETVKQYHPGMVNSTITAERLKPGPEVIKLLSCSTQLSMKISQLINMKMPTIVGIFIFISRENFMLS